MFEQNGTTFVEDDDGNLYSLQLIPKVILEPTLPIAPPSTNNPDIDKLSIKINQIENMLNDVGVPKKLAGYKILVYCICLLSEDFSCRKNFKCKLYPKVADICNIKMHCIPTDITTLILSWSKVSKENFQQIANTINPKIFILKMTDYFLEQTEKRL